MTPRCPKCNGMLVPDKDVNNRTRSIGCVNCGHRIYRTFAKRQPTAVERDIAHHKGLSFRHSERGIS